MVAYVIEKDGKYFDIGMAWCAMDRGFQVIEEPGFSPSSNEEGLVSMDFMFSDVGFPMASLFPTIESAEEFMANWNTGGRVLEVDVTLTGADNTIVENSPN